MHEMVFGFSAAIITGFLLTAVQTWTGVPGVKGRKLAALFFVWLAGRLLLLFPGDLPVFLISTVDLLFVPLVAIALAYPVIATRQKRNMIFIPILLLLFLGNLGMHLGIWNQQPTFSRDAVWASVVTLVLLISIMGGRVIPFFTARATGTEQPAMLIWLELLANIPLLLLVLYYLGAQPEAIGKELLIATSITAALFQLVRFLRWQFWLCFREPLLWSLHGCYLFIPVGLLLLAWHYGGGEVTASQALHSFTVGAIGGLILAMISRVSLGHTGRQLKTLPGMGFAFFLMLLAALTRSPLAAFQILTPVMSLSLSFIFFMLAYGIFLWRYIPVLTKKRIDGRPG